jgi:NTE family protein
MEARLDWDELHAVLASGTGWAHSAAVVTTASATGRTTVFVEGQTDDPPPSDDVRGLDFIVTRLGVSHVLASAAIPVAFRPVQIHGADGSKTWHVDGGVRLNAPISPALRLGANRLVVVATTPDPDTPQRAPGSSSQPDVFDSCGAVLKSVLTDQMTEDVRTLRRTNSALKAVGGGPDASAPSRPDGSPLQVLPHLFLGPPVPGLIAQAAERAFRKRYGVWKRRFSDLGVLGHLLGGSPGTHGELLSFLFFDRDFHAELIELGRAHALSAMGTGTKLPWRD